MNSISVLFYSLSVEWENLLYPQATHNLKLGLLSIVFRNNVKLGIIFENTIKYHHLPYMCIILLAMAYSELYPGFKGATNMSCYE